MLENGLESLVPYAVAAGLGAIVGLERQYSASQSDQEDSAGVRTHALWGLVGVTAADLSTRPGWEYLYVAGLIATGVLLAIGNILKYLNTQDRGVTTELSQLAVFLIAALVQEQAYLKAVPLAVGVTVLLRAKESLYNLSDRFGAIEMNATIRFAVIAGAILPFLPDQHMGPLNAFNPQDIWLMVSLVAAVSFFGYMLVLFLGHKGLELTGLLSGLVSSTAATLQLSRQSRDSSATFPHVCAVLLACSVAYPRTLLLVGVVGSKELLHALSLPILGVTGVGFLIVYLIRRFGKEHADFAPESLRLENPLRLGSVLSFGLLYAVVNLLTYWARDRFSEDGVLLFAGVSGISGTSAITLSLCTFDDTTVAARGILLASFVTTVVKAVFVAFLGAPRYRVWTIAGLLTMAAVLGAASMDWLW